MNKKHWGIILGLFMLALFAGVLFPASPPEPQKLKFTPTPEKELLSYSVTGKGEGYTNLTSLNLSEDLYVGDDANITGDLAVTNINASGEVTAATFNTITPVQNQIIVSPAGADFTSVRDALDSITDSGVNNRYNVLVASGIYTEQNPLPGKSYVTVKGIGEQNTTRIQAANAGQDLFTSADFFVLENLSLGNVSGNAYVMNITQAHRTIVKDSVLFNNDRGLCISNGSASLTANNVFLLNVAGMESGYINLGGQLLVSGGRVGIGSNITTTFLFSGSNAISTIYNFTSFESGVTTMISATNGARSVIHGSSFVGMYDGIVLSGGSDTRAASTMIFNAQRDGVRIEGADGTNAAGYALTIQDSGRYDVNAACPTCDISGFGATSLDKFFFVPGADVVVNFIDLKEDDEGTNFIGEVHVGVPEQGSESVFGGGDSHTRGMLVYTYNPTTTTYTNVTTEATSASGSAFTFPGKGTNTTIYVGSTLTNGVTYLQHYGIKASVITASVGGSYVVEYWDGAAWSGMNHMSTQGDAPYNQYAEDIFERAQSEQIRYESAFLSSQVVTDPMSLGTAYYWIRYRISDTVTTLPGFEQFKLHTNRFEINEDGFTERFGAARVSRQLFNHIEINSPVSGLAPSNETVAFASGLSLVLTRNGFNDNSQDAFGVETTIPEGLDTSNPLEVDIIWYADTTNSGDVELELYSAELEIGDLFDGSQATTNITTTATVNASTQYVSRLTTFEIDVSGLVPGELLVYKIERDARVSNPEDTLAGDIVIAGIGTTGGFWRP